MNTLMIISTANPALVYRLFYLSAFCAGGIMLIYSGLRKKYPLWSWLIYVAFILFCVTLGNKLVTASPEDWRQFFSDFKLPATGKLSSVGGIAGLFIGVSILKTLFRLKVPLADHFAYILPVTIGITRFGCLFDGCCFGKPTHLPWAIHYGQGFMASQVQQAQGLVHQQGVSLGIHPTQIYDIIICALTIVLVWKTRYYWKAKGSRLIFAALFYSALRFGEEFFTDGSFSGFLGQTAYGLKMMQWLLLAGIILMSIILVLRERKWIHHPEKELNLEENTLREFIILAIILTFYCIHFSWFSLFEHITLLLFLLPVTANFLFRIYTRISVPVIRWSMPMVLLMGVFLMGQSYVPEHPGEKVKYTEIKIGGFTSSYDQLVRKLVGYRETSGGCSGTGQIPIYAPELRKYSTSLAGMQVSYNVLRDNKYTKFTFAGGAFYGKDLETCDSSGYHKRQPNYGVNISVNWDFRYIGFGGGFQVGKLRMARFSKDMYSTVNMTDNNVRNLSLLPILDLRLGPKDILYAEGNLGGHFPSSSPMPFYTVGLGSGLGKTNGTMVTAGYSNVGFYLESAYVLKDRFVLEGFYADNIKSGISNRRVFSLGFGYRFNFKSSVKND